MPEMSNLLRQRLSLAENGAQAHPDADTLTAYVEQLLPAREREQVVTHLSACGECREVVALSQPELSAPIMQPVVRPESVSRWRRLFTPAFGLAASVAAMAVIAILVLQMPHSPGFQPQSAPEAKVAPLSDQKAASNTAPAAPAQPTETRAASGREEDKLGVSKDRDLGSRFDNAAGAVAHAKTPASAKKELASKAVVSGSAEPVLAAKLTKQDFVNTGFFAANAPDNLIEGQSNNDLPQAPQPQPSASRARFNVNGPAPITSFSDIPPNAASNKSDVRIMTPPPPPDHFCPGCKIVEKGVRSVFRRAPGTAPAISANGLTFSAMGGQGKFNADLQKSEPAEVAAAPEKPGIGGLEHSDALSSRSMSGAPAASADSALTSWKVVGGKLVKSVGPSQWEDAYPAANFQFSFVTARANDVWAGGTRASLIHSRDGGGAWETVKLGEAASGSIANILFSGNHVQVKTSDDQTWSSADGGKTWVLQPSQN